MRHGRFPVVVGVALGEAFVLLMINKEPAVPRCAGVPTRRRRRKKTMFILRNYQILTGGTATVTKTGTAPGTK